MYLSSWFSVCVVVGDGVALLLPVVVDVVAVVAVVGGVVVVAAAVSLLFACWCVRLYCIPGTWYLVYVCDCALQVAQAPHAVVTRVPVLRSGLSAWATTCNCKESTQTCCLG